MAAHAAITASLWSIAAVIFCDRCCDGVQRASAAGGPLLAQRWIAPRATQLGYYFPARDSRGEPHNAFLDAFWA